jgi:uncharacterized protein YcbK (DUF882 family)
MREKLTQNFYRDEFACRCGCGFDTVDIRLVEGLQRLRDSLGGAPITINSACRCVEHNRAVGGEANSQHLLGKAADIVVQGYRPGMVANAANTIAEFAQGGIGNYTSFTHLDVRRGRARWNG